VAFEEIAKTSRIRPFKLFEHNCRAYWTFSILPALVQEAHDLALLVASEAKLSPTDPNKTKLGVGLDGRFGG
jgi:hypothetical protein